MTENLASAGRGEGLAGLREKVQVLSWRLAHERWNKVALTGEYRCFAREEGRTCTKCDVLDILAALEAAPAGTAHDVIKADCARCSESYPQRHDKPDYIPNFGNVEVGDWTHPCTAEHDWRYCQAARIHEALFAAALATPSPQAPPVMATAAGMFSNGDNVLVRGEICGLRDERDYKIEFETDQSINYAYAQLRDVLPVPAATQEQPAGGGASSNEHELLVGGIVRAALELAILRGDLRMDSGDAFEEMSEREDVITDTWNAMNGEGTCDDEPVKELKAIYVALGSPRKVGEDAPVTRETLEHWLRVVKSTLDPDGWDCGAPELRRMREQLEFALSRPSSVPVGEQKQEEGV